MGVVSQKLPPKNHVLNTCVSMVTDSQSEVKPTLDSVLYLFSQPHSDFTVHPQMSGSDTEGGEGSDVVSRQPYYRKHEGGTSVGRSCDYTPGHVTMLLRSLDVG